MRRGAATWGIAATILGVAMNAAPAIAQSPLTLEDALREARTANGRLPMPAADLLVARERLAETRAERWLKVAVEGDFIYAPPSGYDPVITNAGEFRLQAVGRQPIYDGGARSAAVARSEAELDAAGARYRIVEKDVELEVRSRFAEWLFADAEAAARREGIERLRRYQTTLQSRRASGQGVGADLLRTNVRLASEQASLLEAQARRDAARIALNALMGRDPAAPLVLAPLPDPLASPAPPRSAEQSVIPEVRTAEAEARVSASEVANARAEAKPHLSLSGDVGFLGSDTHRLVPSELLAADPNASFSDRVRRDAGYSLTLSLSWNVFDFGATRSRVRQAELRLASARRNVLFQTQEARRQRAQAEATLASVGEEIRIFAESSPAARDAYLDAESRYRGGAATSLEVLDAYAAAVDALVKGADAISRYRIAEALLERWSAP